MMEEHVQEIFDDEALKPDNEWFEGVPVHKEDEDVDMWFTLAVQASCCSCQRLTGMLQIGLCWCLLHTT